MTALDVTDSLVSGYRFILPPGWCRLPLDEGTDAALRRELDRAVPESVPAAEAVRVKMQIHSAIQPALDDARRAGARDLYLPLRGMGGLAIPASFVVTEFAVTDQDALAVLRERALAAGADVVEIDGVEAVRDDSLGEASVAAGSAPVRSRSVNYAMSLPNVDRLLIITFTTVGDGDPEGEFADVLVGLFDAVVGTVRFTRS